MIEIDLIDRSPFRWMDLLGTGKCLSAKGFNRFALVADLGIFILWHCKCVLEGNEE